MVKEERERSKSRIYVTTSLVDTLGQKYGTNKGILCRDLYLKDPVLHTFYTFVSYVQGSNDFFNCVDRRVMFSRVKMAEQLPTVKKTFYNCLKIYFYHRTKLNVRNLMIILIYFISIKGYFQNFSIKDTNSDLRWWYQ